ncbi:MAG TPA: mycofactocin-associated electron transfer flavoprotein beta subunit [Amycolatopsis sp.]|uniref:mycofactocin-associated electron transfer flavoprotein beta subunit n=1 Tax=Amycolatopsis sp. TaxID=37632 RepID=UPI002B488CA3|nr:mycofactocin-associated electron transfer flavoprotein beta subunit [Amycolatopsis sp.]HKS48630.1 mycofactocin-associated electron transfer flavoprotein beta subunit [Amycolatopsis sp.]
MLIVVALRRSDRRAAVDPLSGEVATDPHGSGASTADQAALEHALRIRSELGGRCVAVTVGPAGADEMLREALAVGADDVLRVEGPDPAITITEDGSGTARLILAGLAEPPDIVLCGDHSADRGTGSTPAFLAHRLNAAQALGLVELTVSGGRLHAVRRLDGGRRERLAFDPPAVCSVEPAGMLLRRASLPAVLTARRAAIPVVRVGSLDAPTGTRRPYRPRPKALPVPEDTHPHRRVLELTGALVERTPPKVITAPTPAEAAQALLGYLRERGAP